MYEDRNSNISPETFLNLNADQILFVTESQSAITINNRRPAVSNDDLLNDTLLQHLSDV